MLKIAVIGLGDISGIHLAAILANPKAELVAVSDIDETRREIVQGVNFYTDYQEMLEQESLDCVHICLPHYLHYPVTKACVEKMRKTLPLLVVSGDEDPVGNMGKGTTAAADAFKAAGIKDVTLKLYRGDRHEILNELDREQVYEDIYQWLEAHK